MSLSENLLSTQARRQEVFTTTEAFTAIILAATASDGYISQQRADDISSALLRIKLFSGYSGETVAQMLDKLLGLLRRDGFNVLFNTAKESLPQNLRETSFAVATDLVLSDSVVSEEERSFLNDLHQALNIDTTTATKIVEIMTIKNQG
ncbi:tellurite resistance TerB family protein [Mastigocoleus testarum]|uniref:Tellurite resistance protein TerB n=1 Tax=Mastigocoleus testarum BC008 TaxID=371196 RepID=A0A0V7ZGJ5_9CYAN|nr:tellurite resistance TerB family protein [Mastigocoleus testarum]KST63722.1 Tellurite resistance protein TerB [Mastigocoleus testarum BC008]KST69214.1 Tellurite resistance protein TerB [Mastigocoleus testarum BC008]